MARHRKRPPGPPPEGYEVGYKRPPQATRWRKGQTGNPRGRPPKEEPDLIADALRLMEVMARTSVPAQGPLGEIQVQMLDGIVQRLLFDAMNESKSASNLLALYAKLNAAKSARPSPDADDDDQAQLERFEQRLARRLSKQPISEDDDDIDN